jgi:TRAP transporter 4TM/12TM fusion protein
MKIRQLSGSNLFIVRSLATLMSLYALLYWTDLFTCLGMDISARQHSAAILGLVLVTTYFLFPATRRDSRDKVPWYDVLLALLSLVPCAYVVFFYEILTDHFAIGLTTRYEVIFGLTIMLMVIEATRRVIGPILTALAVFFCLHPLVANYFPWIFHARGYSIERVVGHFYLSGDGILGLPMAVCAKIVVPFIIFGQILQSTGGGGFFLNLALSSMGHMRGGAAKAATIASGLFGMLSGSSLANVATTGVVTIPLMKRIGYTPEFAGAVEAVASNGGSIVPPIMGAVAFIMAEILNIPYWNICVAALIPALLYYFCIVIQIDLRAAKAGIRGLPRKQLPSLKKTLKDGWVYLPPFFVLIYLLSIHQYSPGRGAFWSIITLIITSSLRKGTRLNGRKVIKAFENVGRIMCTVGVACSVAGIIMASIGLTAIGIKFTGELIDLSGGNSFMLLLIAAAGTFILGMGLPQIACYIMVAILVAPALIQGGIQPIAAHLFAYWFALTSFITPPVCLSVYTASSIAKSNIMRTGIQAVGLGVVMYIVPFIFVYNSSLLLMGSIKAIIISVIAASVGILMLGVGVEGYSCRNINWLERSLFVATGILFLICELKTLTIGAFLIAILALFHFRKKLMIVQ